MGERTGQRFGAYTMGAHVADGSMGAIYEARHEETAQRVAIKVLHPKVARNAVAVERFRREYETAKSLRHAHIIEVLDFGETADGAEFMTMEFLEGEELSLLLAREGALRPARTARIVCQRFIMRTQTESSTATSSPTTSSSARVRTATRFAFSTLAP